MALKKKITRAEYEALGEHLKTEYVEDGENFRLDLDGDEDIGELKKAKDREAGLRREAEKRLGEREKALSEKKEELDRIANDSARKKGDIKALEESWAKKVESQKNDYEARLAKLTKHVTSQLVDNVALQLAQKISNAPSLILPHIKARIVADFEGETPITRVLDKEGGPSAFTLEELEKEFIADKEFAPVLIASKASGAVVEKQANKLANNNNIGFSGNSGANIDLAKASPREMSSYLKAKKGSQE